MSTLNWLLSNVFSNLILDFPINTGITTYISIKIYRVLITNNTQKNMPYGFFSND